MYEKKKGPHFRTDPLLPCLLAPLLRRLRGNPHVGALHEQVAGAIGHAGHVGAVDDGVGRTFPEGEELGRRLLLAGRPHAQVAVAVHGGRRLGDDEVLGDEFRAGTITAGNKAERGGEDEGGKDLLHGRNSCAAVKPEYIIHPTG